MSIRPEGGWEDPPPQDHQQGSESNHSIQNVNLPPPSYMPRSSYLTCKVCDRGALTSKKVFRMSGPAVVIGVILLIPSFIGMATSVFMAIMFVGTLAYRGNQPDLTASEQNQQFQSAFDVGFRRSCAKNFKQNSQVSVVSVQMPLVEQYCECALQTFKDTGSETAAAETCNQRANDGTLDATSQDVDALYSGDGHQETLNRRGKGLFLTIVGAIGVGWAIALGIASFVGGLLGWLLVMKKRVLQCDFCGAVVHAS